MLEVGYRGSDLGWIFGTRSSHTNLMISNKAVSSRQVKKQNASVLNFNN